MIVRQKASFNSQEYYGVYSFTLSFVKVATDHAVETREELLPEVTTGSQQKENKEEIKIHNSSWKMAQQ